MKKSLKLIEEIIEMEKKRDLEFRRLAQAVHKSIPSDGMSQVQFYLRALKELIEEESIGKDT